MRAADLHRLARSLREIALLATGNTGADAVSAGELAVLEDVAQHPGSTVSAVAARAHVAQSLVSRIAQRLGAAGVLIVESDPDDRRRTRLSLAETALPLLMRRGDAGIDAAVLACTPALHDDDRAALEQHLAAAAAILARAR